jgi:hypothetical protein
LFLIISVLASPTLGNAAHLGKHPISTLLPKAANAAKVSKVSKAAKAAKVENASTEAVAATVFFSKRKYFANMETPLFLQYYICQTY